MLYFQRKAQDFAKQVQEEQGAFYRQLQNDLVQRHEVASRTGLLNAYAAGTIRRTQLLANSLWDKNFARFVAKAQRIPVEQCRVIVEMARRTA